MRAVAVIALVSVCAPAHAFLGAGAGLTRQAPLARAERSAATKASAVRMQFKMPEMPAFSMPSFNGGAAGATAVGTVAVSGSRFVETMGSCAELLGLYAASGVDEAHTVLLVDLHLYAVVWWVRRSLQRCRART